MITKTFIGKMLVTGLFLLVGAGTGFSEPLPRLVDVGADKCIPCIKMAPILDQLREDFAGRLEVKFVDAWKNREEASG